jgi:hypothetical protein
VQVQVVGIIGAGLAVAVANGLTTRALWSSPMFDRSQKIAQTVLIWLVPGLFAVTRHLVHAMADSGDASDPTVHREQGYADDPTVYHHGHGDDGGHH